MYSNVLNFLAPRKEEGGKGQSHPPSAAEWPALRGPGRWGLVPRPLQARLALGRGQQWPTSPVPGRGAMALRPSQARKAKVDGGVLSPAPF